MTAKREKRKRPRARASAELDLLECACVEMTPWQAVHLRQWPGDTTEEQESHARRAVQWFISDGVLEMWLAADEWERPLPSALAVRLLAADAAWEKDGPYLMAISAQGARAWREGVGWSWWRDGGGATV